MIKPFDKSELKKLYKPDWDSSGEDNGQITIIGGSKLFHGAPLLSLKVASRIVDMVFFASPDPQLESVVSRLKASLFSFIWVPWEEVEEYVAKSDAILIGPGLMRYAKELRDLRTKELKNKRTKKQKDNYYDEEGRKTREITKRLLTKFPNKKWVIDAGSLQVMDAKWIPEKAILTPNNKEFEMLFGDELRVAGSELGSRDKDRKKEIEKMAEKYKCTIVLKGPETVVCSPTECVLIKGGNPGLTKGGTGDVLAGLTVALFAKNDSFLAASAASYIAKAAADELYKKVGNSYNADDLAEKIPSTLKNLLN